MTRDHDRNRKELLDETAVGPIVAEAAPPRRGWLKGTLAAVGAALGFPLVGSTGARAATDEEIIRYYSQPEEVDKSIEDNAALFDTMDEIGFFDGSGRSHGLQVSSVTTDGEKQPEQRIGAEYDFGILTVVISPGEYTIGGYSHVVTDDERMELAPFEWPLEKGIQVADGRLLFRIEPDGWADVRKGEGWPGDPTTTYCGIDLVECIPTVGECWRIGCCGRVERTGPCGDDDSSSSEDRDECEDTSFCRANCYEFLGECVCHTVQSYWC